jgi:hypothetical protein
VKFTLTLLLSFCYLLIFSQNGIDSVFVEKWASFSLKETHEEYITYRIYADLKKGYRLQAIYGINEHPLIVKTSGHFYNHPEGSFLGTNLGSNTFSSISNINETSISPKFSDRSVKKINLFFSKIKDFETLEPQIVIYGNENLSIALNNSNNLNINQLHLNNTSIACMNGVSGLDTNNYVLLGQLSTNGKLYLELNLQLISPEGKIEKYVARKPNEFNYQPKNGCLIYNMENSARLSELKIELSENKLEYTNNEKIQINCTVNNNLNFINSIDFYINDVLLIRDYSYPYSAEWLFQGGFAKIRAIANFNSGHETSSNQINIYKK